MTTEPTPTTPEVAPMTDERLATLREWRDGARDAQSIGSRFDDDAWPVLVADAVDEIDRLRTELATVQAENDRLRSGGAGRIAAERERQISTEGYTAETDTAWTSGELALGAVSYAIHARWLEQGLDPWNPTPPSQWPWPYKWWKPSANPIRNLEKAGALIAAEIDRLNPEPAS